MFVQPVEANLSVGNTYIVCRKLLGDPGAPVLKCIVNSHLVVGKEDSLSLLLGDCSKLR